MRTRGMVTSAETRYAHVITVTGETGDVVSSDAERVVEAFEKHQFKSGRKHHLRSAKELNSAIYGITNMGDGLHLIYVIANVANSKMVDAHGEEIRVRNICRILNNTVARKVVMLQMNLPRKDHLESSDPSYGKAARHGLGRRCKPQLKLLNHPKDLLLAYLPRFGHHDVSVVDYLCKGLRISPNFDELLAYMTNRAEEDGMREFPSYSSTMRESIRLSPEASEGRPAALTGGRTFAFFVEDFGESRRRGGFARDIDAGVDLGMVNSSFRKLRCEVECKRGKITADAILKEMDAIAFGQRSTPSPSLTIVVSSHGSRGGVVLGSDKSLHIRDLLCRLEDLNNVPKIILVHARRGHGNDWWDSASESSGGNEEKICVHLPENTLLVVATSDGNKSNISDVRGSNIIRDLCDQIDLSLSQEVDVFNILHHVASEVSSKTIPDSHWYGAKQQLMFASSLTKPLRFSIDRA